MEMFADKTWLIYGRLEMSKKELKEAIASRGGRVVSSVSGKLNFLLWNGETLVPGDETFAAKPSQLLEQGGLVVGEDDFMQILDGKVSGKIRTYLESSAASPAKPSPKKRTKKKAAEKRVTPPTPESLLERVIESVRTVNSLTQVEQVEQVIDRCVTSGYSECATALAHALPETYRGMGLLQLALSEQSSADEAIDLVMAGYDRLESYNRPQYAARALVLGARAEGVSPRAAKLLEPAHQCIEAAFAEGGEGELEPILAAQMSVGDVDGIRALLLRCRDSQPDLLQYITLREGQISVFADDPKAAFSVLACISDSSRRDALEHASVVEAFSSWPHEDLQRLSELMYEGLRTQLGRSLADRDRMEEARAILFPEGGPDVQLETLIERHLIVGDIEQAKRLLASEDASALTKMRIEHGVETIEEALARFDANPMDHVMADVNRRTVLANLAFDRDRADTITSILASIDAQMQRPERSPYDLGVGAARIGEIATLRVRNLMQKGDVAGARAQVEADLKGVKALQDLAAKNQRDPGMRTYSKNAVASALVARAGIAGQPDLCIKASKKIAKKERETAGSAVARWFLPDNPGLALDAFENVSGKEAPRYLISRSLNTAENAPEPFFVALWSATLALPRPS